MDEHDGAVNDSVEADDDYLPSEDDLQQMEEDMQIEMNADEEDIEHDFASQPSRPSVIREDKFIVFQSSLCTLLKWCHCPDCGSLDINTDSWRVNGSQLGIEISCLSCKKKTVWYSQPSISRLPVGNLAMAGAILFAGANPSKVLRVFRHMRLAAISLRTFFRLQQSHLFPAIEDQWVEHQSSLLQGIKDCGQPVVIGGDGRADSPGHCAKFGTYTMVDLQRNKILHTELVQVAL